MSTVSHQTIKLSPGKHTSPRDGACVMELASMLSGEPFSDHPVSVCPVIGSLLRAYNDSVGERRRQALYAYAAKLVGSRSGRAVELARAERVATWTDEIRRRPLRWLAPSLGFKMWGPSIDSVGSRAVHAIPKHNEKTQAAFLRLVDELLEIGVRDVAAPVTTAGSEQVLRGSTPAGRAG